VLESTSKAAEEFCREAGAVGFSTGTDEAQRWNLWRARHEARETNHRVHTGKETLIVDATVPISSSPEMVMVELGSVDEMMTLGYVFGRAGDDNLHVVPMGDPDDEEERPILEEMNSYIVSQAIEP